MTSLVAGQIVFLECRQTRLYAEVIQVLEPRSVGWIRPLAMVSETQTIALGTELDSAALASNKATVPDMLWPLDQLQPALDTEVIPLLATLSAKAGDLGTTPPLANDVNPLTVGEFVRWLWADRQLQP
ncbi:hypothetical protein VB780_04385 [Leptolyngbya sp. CCNP1308]|uniref:hypothetical protein n=1 Tax=Leptolyngbya sp. CCNP1308 TaxID=3110255 RepID=UPI002B1F3E7B|nr:hypothetical protein [Leptolyngbya sp. CCNP1308]MEA5447794.1 hypothetical protein [Leptolyngbya sp. CCNP1308]